MKTVFLCGPYKGNIGMNVYVAVLAARYLRDHGYNVFCPHVAIAGYCRDMDEEDKENRKKLLAMCLQWVEICDCFAIIPGWEQADGCRGEYAIAEANEKEIISLTYGQIEV